MSKFIFYCIFLCILTNLFHVSRDNQSLKDIRDVPATVEYCKQVVSMLCGEYGADESKVILAGFEWLASDINHDCKVDFLDLARLAAEWLQENYSTEYKNKNILLGRMMMWCPPGFWKGAQWNLGVYDKVTRPWSFSDYAVNEVSRLSKGVCWDGVCEYGNAFGTEQPYPNHVRPMEGAWEFNDTWLNRNAQPQVPDLTGYEVTLKEACEDHPEFVRFIIDQCLKFGVIPDLMIVAPLNITAEHVFEDDVWWTSWWSTPCRDGVVNAYYYFMEQAEDRGLKFAVSPCIHAGETDDGESHKYLLKAILDRGYTNWLEIDGRIVVNKPGAHSYTQQERDAIESYIGRQLFLLGVGDAADVQRDNLFLAVFINQPTSLDAKYSQWSASGKPWCPFFAPSINRNFGSPWNKVVQPFNETQFRAQWATYKKYPQNLPPQWGISRIGYLYENNCHEDCPWMKTTENGDAVLRICQEEMQP